MQWETHYLTTMEINMKLSIIIPSYKDPYLYKTVESLLQHSELGDELEIVVVLDGYWFEHSIDDDRVKVIHLGKNVGMREAINTGVRASTGEYIMRTDEHSDFDQGYDKKLLANVQDDWIVTPRRYYLDPIKWERMDLPYVDYEKLVIQSGKKFAGLPWRERDKERSKILVDETMAMQGSCWIMKRSWWDKVIIELDTEGYGPLYQDSHEMVFKTWKAGGKLMINKKTWHAHKHRSFSRTHSNGTKENPSNNEVCWAYSLNLWKDYYKEIKTLWKI